MTARSLVRFVPSLFVISTIAPLWPIETASAQEIMPLSQIKRGDRGYGLTVFSGSEPEKFDFEVLGIVNVGPARYIVVVLYGGPKDKNGNEILSQTNIFHGMSGSPLYINDKLIGALSESDEWSKSRQALVTPIEFMMNFWPKTVDLAKKLTYERERPFQRSMGELNPGDIYLLCDYWGDENSCASGTVTAVDPNNPGTLFITGHSSSLIKSTGMMAVPIWGGRIVTLGPSVKSSKRMSNRIGPILGTALFNGSYGQIVKLGAMPKSISMKVTLENYFKNSVETRYSVAYTQSASSNIAGIIIGRKELIDPALDVDAEVRIDIAGLEQIYSYGAFNQNVNAGSITKIFITEELNPVIERVAVILRARPKYKVLNLEEVTASVARVADNRIFVDLSILTEGEESRSRSFSLSVDKKFQDKKLYVSSGEEIANQFVPTMKPGVDSAGLLNRISDRNALYVYYAKETKDTLSNTPVIFIGDISIGQDSVRRDLMASKQAGASLNAGDAGKKEGWQVKPLERNQFEILAKLESLDREYLVKGKKEFTIKLEKKKKKFLFF